VLNFTRHRVAPSRGRLERLFRASFCDVGGTWEGPVVRGLVEDVGAFARVDNPCKEASDASLERAAASPPGEKAGHVVGGRALGPKRHVVEGRSPSIKAYARRDRRTSDYSEKNAGSASSTGHLRETIGAFRLTFEKRTSSVSRFCLVFFFVCSACPYTSSQRGHS